MASVGGGMQVGGKGERVEGRSVRAAGSGADALMGASIMRSGESLL